VDNARDNGLKAWRVAKGLSQTEAGRRFKVKQATWSRFENGVVIPPPKLAKRIAEVVGVPLEKVLGLS
jgi:transcriptional regulator with XRE-family HTH domain